MNDEEKERYYEELSKKQQLHESYNKLAAEWGLMENNNFFYKLDGSSNVYEYAFGTVEMIRGKQDSYGVICLRIYAEDCMYKIAEKYEIYDDDYFQNGIRIQFEMGNKKSLTSDKFKKDMTRLCEMKADIDKIILKKKIKKICKEEL